MSSTLMAMQALDLDNSRVHQKSNEHAHLLLSDLLPGYVPFTVGWLFENVHRRMLLQ